MLATMTTERRFRAKCLKCGRWAREVSDRPGTVLSPGTSSAWGPEKRWTAGKTVPDHLPLVVLCRGCLQLKPAKAVAA